MRTHAMLAQAADGRGPQWLEGSLTLPFEWVGLVIGLAILGGLVYFALRAARDAQESQADRELRDRARAMEPSPEDREA